MHKLNVTLRLQRVFYKDFLKKRLTDFNDFFNVSALLTQAQRAQKR